MLMWLMNMGFAASGAGGVAVIVVGPSRLSARMGMGM